MRTLLALVLALSLSVTAQAATWYVGTNWSACAGSCTDNPSCGTTAATSCATLAYFNTVRQPSGPTAGDTVRLTGTYTSSPTNTAHCVRAKASVTWEGRTAADGPATDYTAATIDGKGTALGGICNGAPLGCEPGACTFSFASFIGITFDGTNSTVGGWLQPATGAQQTGILFDKVRFTHMNAGNALYLGHGSCIHDSACTRSVDRVVIKNSAFTNNLGHGLWLGAVDTVNIENSDFSYNGPHWCKDGWTPLCDGTQLCNADNDVCEGAYDGLVSGSAIAITVDNSDFHHNAQNGIDISRNGGVGDLCDAVTHGWLIRGSRLYDNGHAGFSVNSCAWDVDVVNNMIWKSSTMPNGLMFHGYGALCDVRVVGNTFWSQVASGSLNIEVPGPVSKFVWKNNIMRLNRPSNSAASMYYTTFQPGLGNEVDYNTWTNVGASGTPLKCGPTGTDLCATQTADSDWPTTCVKPTCGTPGICASDDVYANSAAGRDDFTATWGAAFGSHDPAWGAAPTVVNSTTMSAANLHLSVADTVARNAGLNVASLGAGFGTDYDYTARAGTWDIGADDPDTAASSTTTTTAAATTTTTTTLPASAGYHVLK